MNNTSTSLPSSSSSSTSTITEEDNQANLVEGIINFIETEPDPDQSIPPSSRSFTSSSLSSTSRTTNSPSYHHPPQTSIDLVPFALVGNVHTGTVGRNHHPHPLSERVTSSSPPSIPATGRTSSTINSSSSTGIVTSNQDTALEHLVDTLIPEASTIVPSSILPSSSSPSTTTTTTPSSSTIEATLTASTGNTANDKRYMEHLLNILDYPTTQQDVKYAQQIGTDLSTIELMKNHLPSSSSSSSSVAKEKRSS